MPKSCAYLQQYLFSQGTLFIEKKIKAYHQLQMLKKKWNSVAYIKNIQSYQSVLTRNQINKEKSLYERIINLFKKKVFRPISHGIPDNLWQHTSIPRHSGEKHWFAAHLTFDHLRLAQESVFHFHFHFQHVHFMFHLLLPSGEKLESSERLGATAKHFFLFASVNWRIRGENRRQEGRRSGGQRRFRGGRGRTQFSITCFGV